MNISIKEVQCSVQQRRSKSGKLNGIWIPFKFHIIVSFAYIFLHFSEALLEEDGKKASSDFPNPLHFSELQKGKKSETGEITGKVIWGKGLPFTLHAIRDTLFCISIVCLCSDWGRKNRDHWQKSSLGEFCYLRWGLRAWGSVGPKGQVIREAENERPLCILHYNQSKMSER